MIGVESMCVCVCVCVCAFSNMNFFETTGLIAIKFYLKHYLGRGRVALDFGVDRFRTLVSMTTDSFHRVIMGKRCCHFFSAIFHPILFILAVIDDTHESLEGFEIRPDPTTDWLAAL